MMIVKFRSSAEHEDLLKKVKKMKKFAAEIEECLEDHSEEEYGYREDYDDDEDYMKRSDSRYSKINRRGRM